MIARLLARLLLTALLPVAFLAVSRALLLVGLLAGVLLSRLSLICFAAALLRLLTLLRLLAWLWLSLRRLFSPLFHFFQQLFDCAAVVSWALVLALATRLA